MHVWVFCHKIIIKKDNSKIKRIIFQLGDVFLFKKEEGGGKKVKSQMMLLPLIVGMEKDYEMPCSQQICFDLA